MLSIICVFTRESVDAISAAHERDLKVLTSKVPESVKAKARKRLKENDELVTEASIAWFVLHGFISPDAEQRRTISKRKESSLWADYLSWRDTDQRTFRSIVK